MALSVTAGPGWQRGPLRTGEVGSTHAAGVKSVTLETLGCGIPVWVQEALCLRRTRDKRPPECLYLRLQVQGGGSKEGQGTGREITVQ